MHIKSLEKEFQGLLETRILGRPARFYESTDSTNTRAVAWAAAGAPEGAMVFAEHQTTGKGRHGRVWEAQPSSNLLYSLILKPELPPATLGLVTIAASVALAESIDTFIAPQQAAIKWPNDILINGRKCAGMLLESAFAPNQADKQVSVILGIGVNVNQDQFPEPIAARSTSLLLETGRHIPRMALLAQFLEHLETLYFSIQTHNTTSLIDRYTSHLAYLGEPKTLSFIGKDAQIEGIIRGVGPSGALQLETSAGIREFHAGEVTSQLLT